MTRDVQPEAVSSADWRQLGATVRRLRAGRGLSRKALSALADVSERHLAQLESGKGNISVRLLARVAGALETGLPDLFRGVDGTAGREDILIADLVRRLNPADRQKALQMLAEAFVGAAPHPGRLALIGLRGAGKSTLGRRLARDYGLPFVQLVAEIQRLAGMNVSEIFSLSGPDFYRRLEEQALLETLNRHSRCVIETGGSLVTNLNLLNLLRQSCLVVWVRARAEDHMQRVIDQGDLRPIRDNDDAMADLRRLLEQREALYRQAHTRLETSGRSPEECLAELKRLFPPQASGRPVADPVESAGRP